MNKPIKEKAISQYGQDGSRYIITTSKFDCQVGEE